MSKGDRNAMESGINMLTQRRLERVQSARAQKDHSRQQSNSRHQQPELKTVGEFALHHLFNSFVGQADLKIQRCVGEPGDPESVVEGICGPGMDPQFDQLISALGHIARQKPKPLIDTLMLWRKAKSEVANNARMELNQYKNSSLNGFVTRRNAGHLHAVSDPGNPAANLTGTSSPVSAISRQEAVILAERRASVAIYLLCRVLMEIIRQSTLACVTPEMADRLEDTIFGQLKAADIEQLLNSPFKMANWKIFGELLGVMCQINFRSVTERFFKEIDQLQKDYQSKSNANKELVDSRMEIVIMGMRHFHIKMNPQEYFDRSCEFMHNLGKYFVNSHGLRIKHAYCRILERLLLPVAGQAGVELNTPKWRAVVDILSTKASQMLLKPRHWLEAYPLTTILCCVSPVEVFSQQWLQMIMNSQPKLKDRVTRPVALQAISRLVWTYLNRTTEPSNTVLRKLEEVIKVVFPSGKRSYLSTEPAIAEPLIQLIRIIGYKHQDLCFRTVIFPLINSELITSGKDLRVDQLEPEKMVIGIRSFLLIMADLEKGAPGRPPFPLDFNYVPPIERTPMLSPQLAPHLFPELLAPPAREERLSWPVHTAKIGDPAREYYAKFCEILGKITIMCDEAFGGQLVFEDRFNIQTPKTPMSETFSFSRRDDQQAISDQKRGYYDLFHVAVQALPRCLSTDIPFNSLINLLCTGTSHVQSHIASSSVESLLSIARQSHAQQVTIGFARFLLSNDDRYSSIQDGGLLSPAHAENTLQLYVELLQIWIEEIKRKAKMAAQDPGDDSRSGARGIQLDLSGIWAHVDEAESHGLFFLCSQSRKVRSFAIAVLRLVTEFDAALGKDNVRIINILERDSSTVMNFNDDNLSVAERSRLQRGMRKSNPQNALIELSGSDITYDSTLWFKIFPNLVRIIFDRCPFATTMAREIIFARLHPMNKAIKALSEAPKGSPYSNYEILQNRSATHATTPPKVMIEQWKLYLIFACTTLTVAGGQQQPLQDLQHARKTSKPAEQGVMKLDNARTLFQRIMQLLSSPTSPTREAVVTALGSINVNLYKTLLDCLQQVAAMFNDDGRPRLHQRTASSPKRNNELGTLRTEVTHIYKLTSHFLREEAVYTDDSILETLAKYTNSLKIFLSDADVQNNWDYQKLRRHYCGLMEELFEGINRTKNAARWMPFEARKSAFALMEDWCGYSPNQGQIRQREDMMRQSIMEQQKFNDKGTLTAAMEIEKRNLRTAALSAMAALCGGPVSVTTERKANLQFDVRRMLTWIDSIFATPSDKMHMIGRRALKNLIIHNRAYPYIIEQAIQMCYLAELPKALESYFAVVSEVLLENEDYPFAFYKILGAALFTLGHEKSELRSKSAQLLRTLEERLQRSSKIQDYYIGISDKTPAVYRLAQFEISKRLAKQHSEVAFLIFSEFTYYFKNLDPSRQRNMVAAILPWIQTVELQIDPNNDPTPHSYMLLANLFEITIHSGAGLHNEVQALWQALSTGPHAGNVQIILDFIMSLCLGRREQNFVDFAKQIVVFLSSTPAGEKVVQFLLLHITPKAMVQEKREAMPPPPDALGYPYLADLSHVLPVGNKQAGFSLGQLSLILLVDLMVSPVQLAADSVPVLLQIVFVLWDHYIPLVQEQAREMLVHLIHELVMSKIEEKSNISTEKAVDTLIDAVRRHDPTIVWAYDDNNAQGENTSIKVPKSMELLADQVVEVFDLAYPGIREQWGKTTLVWATTCPVRHLACRSFQIFRCILASLDQSMLGDMLARLSNTIADDESDIQTFSMEILTTLKTIIAALSPEDLLKYPQLFWSTCACLSTIHESEFLESLAMLESFIAKVDLSRPETVKLLSDNMPPRWEGSFDGIQPLLYPGLRSSLSLDRTLSLLDKLTPLPSNYLVGDDSRLLFAMLANLPGFLHAMEQQIKDPELLLSADKLAKVADSQGCTSISQSLAGFCNWRHRTVNDFLHSAMTAVRDTFLPGWNYHCLVFLMGLLTNRIGWFKVKVMQLLCVILPDIDMRAPEIAAHGSDLISPLLRLLQTEYCRQALEVLDHIMTMPGTPMDKHHIRMSMAGAQSQAIRKEYARTQSLFGIPDESGWSIPVPADHSTKTRNNVHAVFYTCAGTESIKRDNPATPDLEFHADDFQYGFPFHERTGTMMSDDGRTDGNMGDLVMKLNSLDDFFDDNLISSSSSDMRSPNLTNFSIESVDAGARYDQQTLPLLRKSLTRTASVSSFKNGFTDVKVAAAAAPYAGVMSPTAFAA